MNLKEYYKNRLNSLLEGDITKMAPLPSNDSDRNNDKSSGSPFRRAIRADEFPQMDKFDVETNLRNALFWKNEKSVYPNATTRRDEFVKSQRTIAQPAPLTSDRPTADNDSDFTRDLHADYLHRTRQKELDKDTDDINAYLNSRAKKEIEANKPKTGKTTMNPQFNPGV
jgi:hypothetical protein